MDIVNAQTGEPLRIEFPFVSGTLVPGDHYDTLIMVLADGQEVHIRRTPALLREYLLDHQWFTPKEMDNPLLVDVIAKLREREIMFGDLA